MQRHFIHLVLLVCITTGCSSIQSKTHKRWEQNRNTIYLSNISKKADFRKEGEQLKLALEDRFRDSLYIVAVDKTDSKFELKYMITRLESGSRVKRFFTFGMDDGSRAYMEVKVALLGDGKMLGAWTVESTVKGGPLGGSTRVLHKKISQQILQLLRGY